MEQMSLFDNREQTTPLASRVRPVSLEEFVGQKQLLGEGKVLRRLIDSDHIPSMIFWGPPGVGKTTLASIIAGRTHADFVNFSAKHGFTRHDLFNLPVELANIYDFPLVLLLHDGASSRFEIGG